jgi:hypothetical protein
LLELIEIYFDNVANSALALHKTDFLHRVHAGTATPHVVLSVCAFGAKYVPSPVMRGLLTKTRSFYKDSHGSASLRTKGFMTEWAQEAGKLAFQEIESFSKELVVTFLNLALFWHGQGSWKISSLYKGMSSPAQIWRRHSQHVSKRLPFPLHSWHWRYETDADRDI